MANLLRVYRREGRRFLFPNMALLHAAFSRLEDERMMRILRKDRDPAVLALLEKEVEAAQDRLAEEGPGEW